MKIGLVGWGVETQSAYRYFGPSHEYVIGNEEPREDFPVADNVTVHSLSEKRQPGLVGNVADLSYLDHYDDCELVIFQGATRKNLEKKFKASDPFWAKAKTTLDIFFEESKTQNIIGVTGTKGKGTTTSLIYEMLKQAGKVAYIGGNIGLPTLDLLPKLTPDSYVVLELSNFQLYKFKHSPHIAIHLMMTPEHIDEWHKTMEDYVEAKRNIFSHQKPNDIAIFLPTDEYSSQNVGYSTGVHIPYTEPPGAFVNDQGFIEISSEQIVHEKEVGLVGNHNLQNICAALTAVWQITKKKQAIKQVLISFKGLEHRLQLVAEIANVKYYDDSFGTVPNTAQVALDAFSNPKVLILGGHDKGNDWTEMLERLKAPDVKHIILIGSITQQLLKLMSVSGLDKSKITYKNDGNDWTMPEIIETARTQASAGDIVLLSTGCASFGMFTDYKDRGNQFIKAVKDLADASVQP